MTAAAQHRQGRFQFLLRRGYKPHGGNGGATSTGVTATRQSRLLPDIDVDPVIDFITSEIKVDDTNADEAATLTGFNEYSKYFETYGRKIDLQFFTGTGPRMIRWRPADAVTIANMEPLPFCGPVLVPDFADELAARKCCVSVTPGAGSSVLHRPSAVRGCREQR